MSGLTNYITNNTDLSYVFMPYYGTSSTVTGFKISNGSDLNTVFQAKGNSISNVSATGFKIPTSGNDINTLFMSKSAQPVVTIINTPSGTNYQGTTIYNGKKYYYIIMAGPSSQTTASFNTFKIKITSNLSVPINYILIGGGAGGGANGGYVDNFGENQYNVNGAGGGGGGGLNYGTITAT